MSETAPRAVRAEGVTLLLPEGWEQVDLPVAQLAVAGPPSPGAGDGTEFRPSINLVTAEAAPDADIRTLGTEAIAAAHVVAEHSHVLAYDVWPMGSGPAGRRLVFTYQQGAVPLSVTQWIVLRGSRVHTLTATCAVTQLGGLEDVLGQIAAAAWRPEETS